MYHSTTKNKVMWNVSSKILVRLLVTIICHIFIIRNYANYRNDYAYLYFSHQASA